MSDPRSFLTAQWKNLIMLNYPVDPGLLTDFVPDGTELDSFGGITYVSIVGFLFLDTRVLGLPIPMHRNFEEINLRFYVRREVGGEIRRGVVFVREIVPRRAIALVARILYNENYVAMPMSHSDAVDGEFRRLAYGWGSREKRGSLSAVVNGEPALPDDSGVESFITEHYWGFSRQRDGATVEYEVRHPRWSVWNATNAAFECDVAATYGARFEPVLDGIPASAFVADGSPVMVMRGRRLPRA